MKRFLDTHILISIQLVVVAVVICIAAYSVHVAKHDTYTLLLSRAHEQVLLLEELFVLTDRNGADSATAEVIKDCPRRDEFDTLLTSLSSLGNKDLLRTQQLLESCGGYFAERKALMVVRIEREIDYLRDIVSMLDTLDVSERPVFSLEEWEILHDHEVRRSGLLNEQVTIQGDIITALLLSTPESQTKITELSRRAQSVGETLMVLDQQIDDQRKQLIEKHS